MEYLNRSLKPLCRGSCYYHPHFTGGTTEAQLISHKLILESRPSVFIFEVAVTHSFDILYGGWGWVGNVRVEELSMWGEEVPTGVGNSKPNAVSRPCFSPKVLQAHPD